MHGFYRKSLRPPARPNSPLHHRSFVCRASVHAQCRTLYTGLTAKYITTRNCGRDWKREVSPSARRRIPKSSCRHSSTGARKHCRALRACLPLPCSTQNAGHCFVHATVSASSLFLVQRQHGILFRLGDTGTVALSTGAESRRSNSSLSVSLLRAI